MGLKVPFAVRVTYRVFKNCSDPLEQSFSNGCPCVKCSPPGLEFQRKSILAKILGTGARIQSWFLKKEYMGSALTEWGGTYRLWQKSLQEFKWILTIYSRKYSWYKCENSELFFVKEYIGNATNWIRENLHIVAKNLCKNLNGFSQPRVRNSQQSAKIHLNFPSKLFQESMGSHHIILYEKLKNLRESIHTILLMRIFVTTDSWILIEFLTLQPFLRFYPCPPTFQVWPLVNFKMHRYISEMCLWGSSIAMQPYLSGGAKWKNISDFCLFFPIFPLFSWFLAFFFSLSGVTLCPPIPPSGYATVMGIKFLTFLWPFMAHQEILESTIKCLFTLFNLKRNPFYFHRNLSCCLPRVSISETHSSMP